jgi:hypothetical protein
MRKSVVFSLSGIPVFPCIPLAAALLVAVLWLPSCDIWGGIDNPVDPRSPNYQGYPTVSGIDSIYPYTPADGSSHFWVPTLVAAEVKDATHYEFQIDSEPTSTSNTNTYTFSSWQPSAGVHSWRVRAGRGTNDFGPWSSSAAFVMSAVNLQISSPADKALISSVNQQRFDWPDIAEADQYMFQISEDQSFTQPSTETISTVISEYSRSWSTQDIGKTFYWRVCAHRGGKDEPVEFLYHSPRAQDHAAQRYHRQSDTPVCELERHRVLHRHLFKRLQN